MDVEAADPLACSPALILAQDLDMDLAEDRARITGIVTQILPGWKNVGRENIEVENCSGRGGSQTYKLSVADLQPKCVALHWRNAEAQLNSLSEERMRVAWAAFEENGLVPRRLAQGGNWYIEEWGGDTLRKLKIPALPEELGKFLAKIHQVPTEWFDAFRARLKEEIPTLAQVPDGSHIWWFSARKDVRGLDEVTMNDWAAAMPTPKSEIAARLVTVHADFHLDNLVLGPEGIKAIDLEFSCVTFAVQDLSYVMVTCGLQGQAAKRAFLKAYCEAMGNKAAEKVIDELLVDSEVYVMAQHFGPLVPWRTEGTEYLENVPARLKFAEEARNSAALRAQLANCGIMMDMLDIGAWHQRLFRMINHSLQAHALEAHKHPLVIFPLTVILPLLLTLHLVGVCVLLLPCVLRNHPRKHSLHTIPQKLGLRKTSNPAIVFCAELVLISLLLLIWPLLLLLTPLWICCPKRLWKNGKWAAPPLEAGLVPYERLSVRAGGHESLPGHVVENLLDESKETDAQTFYPVSKWCHDSHGKPSWIEVEAEGPAIMLERYALRSANDSPSSDPKSWKLYGVDAHGKFHILHEVENASWKGRWTWNEYKVATEIAWCHPNGLAVSSFRKFRIDISANSGSPYCTQLGQLKLFEIVEP